MTNGLTDLVAAVNAHEGSWGSSKMECDADANAYQISDNCSKLAGGVDVYLWERYDPRDDFIYPNISNWDDLLVETIEVGSYDILTIDEVLSILFGLHHRNRIVEGLWWSMFERDVTQKLLAQLLQLDID